MSSKKAGVLYEYEFFTRALKNDLDVFIPAGDNLPQDCLCMNSDGEVFKVQVKGTNSAFMQSRKTARFKVTAATGSQKKKPIDCEKVDILAVYIEPHDIFYLIPCLEIANISPWFYPELENSKGRYEKYKEKWDIFKAA